MTQADLDRLSLDAFVPGAVFVHRGTGYVFQLVADGTTLRADGTTLHLVGVGEHRLLQLSREDARSQLRLPTSAAHADALERLIVHEVAVVPEPDLDLLLYLRGTQEQIAAAIATSIDRVAAAPDALRSMAASDLRFQHLKLLGELAWVKRRAIAIFARGASPDLLAYEAELRARRAAVPPRARTSTVIPPHVPVVPNVVVTAERVNVDGWHVLETRLAPASQLFASSLGYWKLHVHEELGACELFVSTMHRDGAMQWIVLSERAPVQVVSAQGPVRATLAGETIVLAPGAPHPGQVLVIAEKDHPADLLASIDMRLRYPQAQLIAWRFGLAAAPGMDEWTAFGGRSERGDRVWAFACGELETAKP